ncbi:hypothetical protein Tco_0750813 [Tanacetum coccineum]|uniref:Uncharacterized protein n=1 Tax=Tanacetum coccineum TaxID=301880 RepID=A0ABQ4Z342_9ASTR
MDERLEHPRIIYLLVLDINHFRHFLILFTENLNPMDDEPMWAADDLKTMGLRENQEHDKVLTVNANIFLILINQQESKQENIDVPRSRHGEVLVGAYRDHDMGEVIVGRPFYKDSCVKARQFDGLITIHNAIIEPRVKVNKKLSKVEGDGEVRVMTRGFGDLVAKLGDKVVMEELVRCWSDGDVVPTSVLVKWLSNSNHNSDEVQTSEHG